MEHTCDEANDGEKDVRAEENFMIVRPREYTPIVSTALRGEKGGQEHVPDPFCAQEYDHKEGKGRDETHHKVEAGYMDPQVAPVVCRVEGVDEKVDEN